MVDEWNMSMQHWWGDTNRGQLKYCTWRDACPTATERTYNGLGPNPALRGDKPATNFLSYVRPDEKWKEQNSAWERWGSETLHNYRKTENITEQIGCFVPKQDGISNLKKEWRLQRFPRSARSSLL